jgi:hypothetical protein
MDELVLHVRQTIASWGRMSLDAGEHFFKKSAPLFFAHSFSIVAAYILKKSAKVVDMVKGRHVLDHAGSVSPFLDQVAEYKEGAEKETIDLMKDTSLPVAEIPEERVQ